MNGAQGSVTVRWPDWGRDPPPYEPHLFPQDCPIPFQKLEPPPNRQSHLIPEDLQVGLSSWNKGWGEKMGDGPREKPNLKAEPFCLHGPLNSLQHTTSSGWLLQGHGPGSPLLHPESQRKLPPPLSAFSIKENH